jgi:hypothetical protein
MGHDGDAFAPSCFASPVRTNNRASIALRMAASTLRVSSTYLEAQFRRFRTKLSAPVAIKAMAAKLARLVYRMLRYGMNTSTREQNCTRTNTGRDRSDNSNGKPPSWDFVC